MSLAGRPGYQETAVGWIPWDWNVKRLGDLCSLITKGTTPTTVGFSYQPTGINFVKVESIDGIGNIDLKKVAYISEEAHDALNRSKLREGDILYSIAGAIGRTAIVQAQHLPANTNQALAIVRPRDLIHTPYLRFVLSSEAQLSHISQISVSSAQANISLKDVSSFSIAFPSPPEQQKIAAILTAVDEKLDVIARQIESTQILKQGLMQTLFSRGVGTQDASGRWVLHAEMKSVLSLDIPASWDVVRLGDIAPLIRRPVEIRPDATYPELGLRSYGKGTFHKPALLGCEVGNKRLFEIKAGDLLFSNVFAWEGAVAVAKPEDDGRYGSHRYITCTVDKSRADTTYIYRYLITPAGIASLSLASPGGAGRNKTLGLSALANISIPLPPLAEQQKISQILDGVEDKLKLLESKQSAVKSLKRGLMQKLLTGEWRVKLDSPTGTA
ncbi:restriction endonuclease subunit S [Pseudomonas sp.]|uniref:restriction endonuclease subunit S n=1 Tax=Pseudomonas sp. TaxID=306 RepID=UPI003A97D578